MRGWQIFRYSFWTVINNMETAFRLSVVLYALQALNQVLVLLYAPEDPVRGVPVSLEIAATFLVTGILAIFASLWIAVAWHRYILTGEFEEGAVPPWHGSLILGYLGRSIMIGLIISLALIAAGVPLFMLANAVPALGFFVLFAMALLAAYLILRLGIILPAGAIGQKLTLGEAWASTSKEQSTILALAVIVVVLSAVLQLPSWLNPEPRSVVNLVYNVVTGWFVTMVGVSLLTTLFAVFIEGRNID
ncbi:hypothetical protein [Antarctobacter jejuensis]|uniref:hypothetical protein n=1 Tax=Antarctobacter jejuensis TaxID=1439938 RepID=UPI003FD48E8A